MLSLFCLKFNDGEEEGIRLYMKELPVKKNEAYTVEIIDNGFEGEGIARIDGFTIFVPNAIKGETCEILIVKVLASHGYGKLIKILKPSEQRVEPDCATYKRCGGCDLRHVKYEETLKMKQNAVQSLVNKTLKNKIQVKPTLGMENPLHYRNKAQYPVGINKSGEPVIGVFANRTHEVIPMEKCLIQNPISEEIAKTVLEFIKKNKISKDSNFENCKIIIPKSTALKQHLKEYCSQNNIDIAPNYEIGDTELIDRLVLNNCGVLLSNIEYEEELLKRDDIQIIKEFQIGEDNKSIATLKKNMCNKATLELVRRIKENFMK